MPLYLYQASYTAEAVKSMVATPQDRATSARALIEAAGGKLHSFYFCFGEYDVMAIIEYPNDVIAAATAMAVAQTGAFGKAHTTTLLTSEEAMEAMRKAGGVAGSYRPPTVS